MIKQILFIKRNRVRKKAILYKQLFLLTFDFTSLFYSLLVIGYFLFAIIVEGNVNEQLTEIMTRLETFSMGYFWKIATVIPVIYVVQSFKHPGIHFSTSEFLLTLLPHTTQQVWNVLVCERWLKAFVKYLFGGVILFLFSPISLSVIVLYIFLLFGVNVLMTIPQWKIFQMHIIYKITILIGIILFNMIVLFFQSPIISASLIVFIIIVNIIYYKQITTNIDWKKVTAASDYLLWNMTLISRATKVKFKKERQYSVWQRLSFWKKPFPYVKESAYHRLWHLYFEKNVSHILQLVFWLFVLLFVLIFIKNMLFLIALALTIHIFTTYSSTLFNNRLQVDIVQILPWDLLAFKRTFIKWIFGISVLFLIPLFVYIYIHFSIWGLVQILVVVVTFITMLHIKLQKSIEKWEKINTSYEVLSIFCYGLLLLLVFSDPYPYVLIVACFIMGIIPFFTKKNRLNW